MEGADSSINGKLDGIYLAQVLLGHGCFNTYLKRFKKRDDEWWIPCGQYRAQTLCLREVGRSKRGFRPGSGRTTHSWHDGLPHAPVWTKMGAYRVIRPIPELHILKGYVNHLFWHGLVPLLTKAKALLWPQKLNIIAKNYYGDIFEGNSCRQLLQESDTLDDPEIYSGVGKIALTPFISAFKAINKIVDCCFFRSTLGHDLDKLIKEMKKDLCQYKSSCDIENSLWLM